MSMPRVSPVEMTILDLLRSGRELYGLEMVKESGALKRGTVYVTLERMTEKGFVTSRQEKAPKDAGMPRRLYRITGQGQAVLHAAESYQTALSAAGGVA